MVREEDLRATGPVGITTVPEETIDRTTTVQGEMIDSTMNVPGEMREEMKEDMIGKTTNVQGELREETIDRTTTPGT